MIKMVILDKVSQAIWKPYENKKLKIQKSKILKLHVYYS